MAEFVRTEIFGTMFDITSRYTQVQPVGMGAFGLVCSARDQLLNQSVAIKKIVKPFKTDVLAKRTYRELKLLMNLRHENVISLSDIFVSPNEDIYFVTELLGTDLHRLLTTRPLEPHFIVYFTYQILRALKFVHSAGIIHRDLKPSNILINENCDLKICDFGLARIQDPLMTGYVATRYYRAPEIMLSWQKYDVAVDIWSVGCILAEMITGSPLFPGKDHVNQFSIITELIGNPPEYIIGGITSENSLPAHEPVSFKTKFPTATPEAIDLLERFLVFDPRRRLTAADALRHPYLELYHDPEDEPEAPHPFDFEDGINASADIWKVKMYDDILSFHNRTQAEENDEQTEQIAYSYYMEGQMAELKDNTASVDPAFAAAAQRVANGLPLDISATMMNELSK
ncbi:Mitogen-activated protein kinase hog1 [Ceratocystis platani]|uniref:Mitogen-activated protein kinase n=1 Tax=Ceratocystis fimbriata f. sp. platani TaxID=88771 RepID=A0A0F8B2C9_CERFI|nr:Mitogen-activated protein kinase hog1 [Ceratocystis platani]